MVVKGTEYYDGKMSRYVDYPITDVLQMMGRAGRPQYDDRGVAVILVHDIKEHFYKKFLYEPFPVESKLAATEKYSTSSFITQFSLKIVTSLILFISLQLASCPSRSHEC